MELTRQGDIVEVIWQDSYSLDGWLNQEALKELIAHESNFVIHTIGYYITQTNDFLYLVQSYDGQEPCRICSIIMIPKPVIRNVEVLRQAEKITDIPKE